MGFAHARNLPVPERLDRRARYNVRPPSKENMTMAMRSRRIGSSALIFTILTVISLTACGPAKVSGTPTMSAEEIFTAAYNTLQAQQATLLASTPPTGTPTSSPSPTVLPPSPLATLPLIGGPTLSTGGGAAGCDNAAYVADVTIPDGTTVAAGKSFDKTWTLQNTGSCAWTTGYKLAFFGGEQMGGSAASVSTTVASGSQTNITVKMTAPSSAGNYTGTWRMQNANGVGFGGSVTVVIKVGSGPTATKGPTLSPDELTGTASAIPTAGDTVTISGKTGAVSVTIHWEGKGIDNTQEFSGTWSIVVPAHWDGTVTPSKGNVNKWTFSPESYSYTDVTNNKFNQDFVATPP
jgi:Ig-like domain from next to BRCA1 gene